MLASPKAQILVDQAFATFQTLVLADLVSQEALGDIEDDRAFAARAAEVAQAHGIALDVEDFRTRPHLFGAAPVVIEGQAPLPGWLPAEVTTVDDHPVVTWLRFGRQRLTESFYDDSLPLTRRQPFNRLLSFRTPLADLEAWAASLPAVEPRGLIFHMSRCGSTLAAQMLAAPKAHVVVSEAAPLNAIVRLEGVDETSKIALLRAMAAILGQARNPGEERCFFKLDCWHSLALPLFRRAFPDTPWVFLYRDPVEVMVSHVRRRGMQMVPSLVPPETFGIDLPDGVPNEDYCARVLAAVCEGALAHYAIGGGRLVNYRQMPEALLTTLLPHFGVEASDAEVTAMRAATVRDAKIPEQAFTPDGEAKQEAATATLREICERRLGTVYRDLEALRAAEP